MRHRREISESGARRAVMGGDGDGAPLVDWLRRVLPAMVIALLVLGGLELSYAQGWRAHDVTTASMGEAAPVGTLVITRSVGSHPVHVGEVIVFHPPGQHSTTFAHRVVAIHPSAAGTLLTTRGDLSGADDPWQVSADDLVGVAVVRLRGVGWLIRLLPWLLFGAAAVALLTAGGRADTRRALRILGGVVVVLVTALHFHPLVRVEQVTSATINGHAQVTAVPTGILPVRINATHGGSLTVHAVPGQLFTARASGSMTGHVEFVIRPWLHGWWLGTVVAICLMPLLIAVGTRRCPPDVAAAR